MPVKRVSAVGFRWSLWLALLASLGLTGCISFPDYAKAPAKRDVSYPSGKATHQVRRGDTLYGIAFANGKRYQDLAAWNSIRPPFTIYPGQTLRLTPPSARSARQTASAKTAAAAKTPRPALVVKPAPKARSGTAAPPRTTSPASRKTVTPISSGATVRVVKRSTPASARTGMTTGPVRERDGVRWKWPARGPILKRYSASTEGKKGLQIGGREGQTIVAAANGKIVYSGSGLRGYGKLIIIEHDKKYLSAYAHNRALGVKEGERVAVGQPIAEMGRTGASRVMLHFEIRRDGQAVDPLRYLPPRTP